LDGAVREIFKRMAGLQASSVGIGSQVGKLVAGRIRRTDHASKTGGVMKRLILFVLALLIAAPAYAERVKGHYRKNGTYVESYQRSNRNSSTLDNYSTRGNVNPYTGKRGTKRTW